ncbi:MAG: hypothetical protein M1832_001416 [Thelocarpon impressellum]|nr:MAG: hypothetical protein M1832_001416 [Thelocarpon impressellum]
MPLPVTWRITTPQLRLLAILSLHTPATWSSIATIMQAEFDMPLSAHEAEVIRSIMDAADPAIVAEVRALGADSRELWRVHRRYGRFYFGIYALTGS